MSTLRKFRKTIKEVNPNLSFPVDMYNNIVGSLVITCYMFSNNPPEKSDIVNQWKKIKKKGLDFWLDDEKFMDKVAKIFEMEVPYGKIAYVQSPTNVLFCPYIDDTILPLREDGIFANTLRNGKIYPILETNVDTYVEKENK